MKPENSVSRNLSLWDIFHPVAISEGNEKKNNTHEKFILGVNRWCKY